MKLPNIIISTVMIMAIGMPLSDAKVPENFFNPPENLHPDPNYTPGEYVMPDNNNAIAAYHLKKAELINEEAAIDTNQVFTLGVGEITFSSKKNETANVLGYFRNYAGVAILGDEGPERVDLIIDMNSLDTAVPGRNNRIMAVFFESMKPELGTASVTFDEFLADTNRLRTLADGAVHSLEASGRITMNGQERALKAKLKVSQQGKTWIVETAQPIMLLISQFEFGERPYDLMKTCNHTALGNRVEVKVKLFFK